MILSVAFFLEHGMTSIMQADYQSAYGEGSDADHIEMKSDMSYIAEKSVVVAW